MATPTNDGGDWSIWCETCGVKLADGTGLRPSAEAMLTSDPHRSLQRHTEAAGPGTIHRFTVRGRITEKKR